ncbi:MAG: hypothetical protein ACRER3_04350 [Pseudomonas fluorescens]
MEQIGGWLVADTGGVLMAHPTAEPTPTDHSGASPRSASRRSLSSILTIKHETV